MFILLYINTGFNRSKYVKKQKKKGPSRTDYLSQTWHLLAEPASFGQGVDGHLACCLGSLDDGTVKVQERSAAGSAHQGVHGSTSGAPVPVGRAS